MLRIFVCISALTAVLTSLVLTLRQAEPLPPDSEVVVLRLAAPYPPAHPTALAAAAFAALVAEESGGQLLIEPFYEDTLGSRSQLLEQLQFGGVALAVVDSATLAEQSPVLVNLLQTTPGCAPEQARRELEERQALLNQALRQEQRTLLAVYTPDYRCIATAEKPVESPLDFQGLRLYQPGELAREYGAQARQMQQWELAQSIANRFADGGELSLLEYTAGDYETVMPYLTVQTQAYGVDFLLASEASLGVLSGENQNLLRRLAGETVWMQQEALELAQKRAQTLLAQRQTQLYPPELAGQDIREWALLLRDYPWLAGGGADA